MIKLRTVTLDDAQTIFQWRNEPYIVNLGSLRKTVIWEEHLSWMKDTVRGINRKAFIIEINNIPAGQIRFDLHSQNSCFVSVYLIKEFAGKGYGIEFIKLGCATIFLQWEQVKIIYALVRRDNEVGNKAFIKAGFLLDTTIEDIEHIGYSLTND